MGYRRNMSKMHQGLTLWHERWAQGRIGFHRSEINDHLLRHADTLPKGSPRVLVPLCGKSIDMHWLVSQGASVNGVELVQAAIDDFWAEADVVPQQTQNGALTQTAHGELSILQADIFAVTPEHLGLVDAVYDRAALIAIPPGEQSRYARHILSLVRPGGVILLLTYDMPLPPEQGPPFSVHPDRVPELYSEATEVSLLETVMHNHETEPKLLKRGVAWAREGIWRIVR